MDIEMSLPQTALELLTYALRNRTAISLEHRVRVHISGPGVRRRSWDLSAEWKTFDRDGLLAALDNGQEIVYWPCGLPMPVSPVHYLGELLALNVGNLRRVGVIVELGSPQMISKLGWTCPPTTAQEWRHFASDLWDRGLSEVKQRRCVPRTRDFSGRMDDCKEIRRQTP